MKDDRGRILCYKCGNEYLKQEHREYQKWIKENGGRFRKGTEFIIPGIIGILLVVGAGAVGFYRDMGASMDDKWGLLLFLAYSVFSIPFCYIKLNDLFAPKYTDLLSTLRNCFAKATISFFLGWIVFTFVVIRFIIKKIMSKKNKT